MLAINPGGTRPPLDGVDGDGSGLRTAGGVDRARRRAPRRDAGGYTVVDAATVFLTHVSEVLRQNAHNFITRAETERLIARVREAQPALVDDLIPKMLSFGDLQRVLQNLVRERVPIRNVEAILEVLADYGGTRQGRRRADRARARAARQRHLPADHRRARRDAGADASTPASSRPSASAIRTIDEKAALVLEPRFAEQVLRKLSEETDRMARSNVRPVLLCPPTLRRHVRRFTERLVPQLSVLSLNEVPGHVSLRGFGVVKV